MFGDKEYDLVKKLARLQGGNPTFGDTIYDLSKKLLNAQGGPYRAQFGDTIYVLWKKILANQGGARRPTPHDTLPNLIQKAALNKGYPQNAPEPIYYYLRYLLGAAGFNIPLLDLFPDAALCLSLRAESVATLTSPIPKVRRSTDNAQADAVADLSAPFAPISDNSGITVTSGVSSETALGAFVREGSPTSNGHLPRWFDQSGNGKDYTQATTGDQPLLYSSGVLIADGVRFETSAQRLTGPALSEVSRLLPFTISFIADFRTAGLGVYFNNSLANGPNDKFQIRYRASNGIQFAFQEIAGVGGTSAAQFGVRFGGIPAAVSRVTITYDGSGADGGLIAYSNGVPISPITTGITFFGDANIKSSFGGRFIASDGVSEATTNFFAVWPRVFSPAEVAALNSRLP